jgi:S1-C subfamily serine protease
MELNAKKCKEIIIDFRKGKINIPQLKIEGQPVARVKSHKLLGIRLDDGLALVNEY